MANYKWRNYQAERLLVLRIWVNSAIYIIIDIKQHLHQLCHNNITLNNNFNYRNVELMCYSQFIYFMHKLFWLKHEKHTKNVVVINVLQHFNTEYALTKFVL